MLALFILWMIYDNKMQNTITLDNRGYERDGYGKLVHRKVAYGQIYNPQKYPLRFREYDIHHIDRNKTNNAPENLAILTRADHKKEHGF